MTNDKTQVETGELRTWSRGTRTRGDDMHQVADDVGGINLGPDTFGVVSRLMCGDVQAKVHALADQVGDTAKYLDIDANDANAVADSFDEIEQTQADRFTRRAGHA
jgi:hypothetical protein